MERCAATSHLEWKLRVLYMTVDRRVKVLKHCSINFSLSFFSIKKKREKSARQPPSFLFCFSSRLNLSFREPTPPHPPPLFLTTSKYLIAPTFPCRTIKLLINNSSKDCFIL